MITAKHDFSTIFKLIKSYPDIDSINSALERLTGIINFFSSKADVKKLIDYIEKDEHQDIIEDYGDFQTPQLLTDQICSLLASKGIDPQILVEPTCGNGNFIVSALKYFKSLKYIYCVDIQEHYEWALKTNIIIHASGAHKNITIEHHQDDIFTHKYSGRFISFINKNNYKMLILGNPPWVTNSTLSKIDSSNLPIKSNLKKQKGIEAITGKGNFDIAESIIINILQQFSTYHPHVAMLCKTSVIRNLVKDAVKLPLKISNIHLYSIDSKKEFDVSADAGLLLADTGVKNESVCTVSTIYYPDNIVKRFGWYEDKFCSDLSLYERYKSYDGESPYEWRQGVKHDAFNVLVLQNTNNKLINGNGESVDVEETMLYPFIKGSELQEPLIKTTLNEILLTQTFVNQETSELARTSPKLWKYLLKNNAQFNKRKSSIYKNKPDYAIFGIGKYSFKPFKVAVSGMYKTPNFALIQEIKNKPVMLDDTCYFLSFDNYREAFYTWILLNTDQVAHLLSSIVFLDAKRPYTKDILSRIDLIRLSEDVSYENIRDTYSIKMNLPYSPELNRNNYYSYRESLKYVNPQLSFYSKKKPDTLNNIQKVGSFT